MTKRTTEADARIVIDDALRKSGWDPADKSHVLTEHPVKVKSAPTGILAEGDSDAAILLDDSDVIPTGRADYVLLDQKGRPLAVVEAKKNAIQPYTAKKQALPYAESLGAPFIFLTNGEIIYFWDYQNDDARIINSFYSRRDLERLVYMREHRKPLAEVPIKEHYLRNGEARQLRPYQVDSMKAIDHGLELNKRRFLIELPTGTGKTDLVVLYLKRLLKASLAERVLFLVDRDQLAKQAVEALDDLLGSQHDVYWRKAGGIRRESQVTVSLLQTMIGCYDEYSSGYFDVVVCDESHRSIYGAWQLSLTHFDAIQIGLTATPAEYIDRNTYKFYQCKEGKPTFSYSIREAFKNKHLAPYKFATGITKLLSDGVEDGEESYDPAAFERKWTNEDTNRKMMAEFDRLAHASYQEQAPGQKTGPGKSIVFAISKQHAARLAQYLNELHPEHKGNYAKVITSDVQDVGEEIRRFKKDTYPQIAVSVGMLDTGFDCREVLHLVLCRRVRSPILYQQMRGRGTRTAPHIDKRFFVIYDFFGNHEYFNDSESGEMSGSGLSEGGSAGGPKPTPSELKELGLEDEWLSKVHYVEVGPNGERIDKGDYISNWEQAVQANAEDSPIFLKIKAGELLTDEEEAELAQSLNSARFFFNEDNLKQAYRRPQGNLIDFVKAALGMEKIKSHEEELAENFRAWLITQKLNPKQANYLSMLKNRGIARGHIEINDLFKPPLSAMNAAALGIELFGETGLKSVIVDINESVFSKEA